MVPDGNIIFTFSIKTTIFFKEILQRKFYLHTPTLKNKPITILHMKNASTKEISK